MFTLSPLCRVSNLRTRSPRPLSFTYKPILFFFFSFPFESEKKKRRFEDFAKKNLNSNEFQPLAESRENNQDFYLFLLVHNVQGNNDRSNFEIEKIRKFLQDNQERLHLFVRPRRSLQLIVVHDPRLRLYRTIQINWGILNTSIICADRKGNEEVVGGRYGRFRE